MKKGISLVALVITIIVLIILTATVILTGANAPDSAKQAVFFNDISAIQDAMTLKYMELYADSQIGGTELSWTGVLSETAATVNGHATKLFDANAKTALNLDGVDLSQFCATTDGVVYFRRGITIGTETFYNRTDKVTPAVATAIPVKSYNGQAEYVAPAGE